MHIQTLTTYPIKSLPGLSHHSTTLTPLGLEHDRIFCLQRYDTSPPQVLQLSHYPQLSLFHISLCSDPETLTVTHTPTSRSISFPLLPETEGLQMVDVVLHGSGCRGYVVGEAESEFFSDTIRVGKVRLLHLGGERRRVLGNVGPPRRREGNGGGRWWGWWSSETKEEEKGEEANLTFADCGAVLVTSMASLLTVGEGIEMKRFRPNIVIGGGKELGAWEEDYWGALKMRDDETGEVVNGELMVTANCVRCVSLNVDYETGGFLDSGRQVLKLLQKDRRVDAGLPWSPVFGRYAFLMGAKEVKVKVGMGVEVTERNKERTRLRWPGITKDT